MPRLAFLLLFVATVTPLSLHGAEPTAAQAQFFENEVRPLLVERCYSCHSDAEGKSRGDLVLDSAQGLTDGGSNGPAIDAKHPEESLLLKAIRYDDPDLQMPPKQKLSDAEIATLTKWVAIGSPWPNTSTQQREQGKTFSDEERAWWSFQPIKDVTPPTSGDGWACNPIDQFIARKLSDKGLSPASAASREVLIRRVSFDLIGLPPTPEEIEQFVHDEAPNAYEKLVNRLLASPRYGERWARHWLDLVRYADSDGYKADDLRPNAWRYRDYVIDAFNNDKPYDQFVKEQLAGDELYPDSVEARIATGYLRHWIYEYNNRDAEGHWDIILNDITDTTADVFLGLGLQCARCHDHKFDPLLQKDYFRLRAFFVNILPRDDQPAIDSEQLQQWTKQHQIWEAKTQAIRDELAEIEKQALKNAAHRGLVKFPPEVQAIYALPIEKRTPYQEQIADLVHRQVLFEQDKIEGKFSGAKKERRLELLRELAKFDNFKPKPLPTAMSVTDVSATPTATVIPKRGTEVEPGFVSIMAADPATVRPLPESTGRRSALANWLTARDNPLTARVMVNRVWQYHFGKGLAENASDFGKLGALPSHPELLDWLTRRFVEEGWSLKKLHRMIVLSATYRQSSDHPNPALGQRVDPSNKWLWRGSIRRLDAEQIRDALLATTGELKQQIGGPGVNSGTPRRSIYNTMMRNSRDPLYDVFDAPNWFNSAADRATTTTPVQSLYLINGPYLLQRASIFAKTLLSDSPSDTQRVELAYQRAYGRSPTAEESEMILNFIAEQRERISPERSNSAAARFQSGTIPTRTGLAALVTPKQKQPGYRVEHSPKLDTADFTIEAVLDLRSIATTGEVRTIAAKWSGNVKEPGWALGISSKGSRRKPQSLVLQLIGQHRDGHVGEAAIFSDQTVPLNKPCLVRAEVTLATNRKAGHIRFTVQDLSSDEPEDVVTIPHNVMSGFHNKEPLTIGCRNTEGTGAFDGLLDDIRLSAGTTATTHTIGYWPFETKPGVLNDASDNGLTLRPIAENKAKGDPVRAAWADFCHVLLNSSEFLYVR